MRTSWAGLSVAAILTFWPLTTYAAASCYDKQRNGPETDVDCGGDCLPCAIDQACRAPRDCRTGRCADGICEEFAYHTGEPLPPGYRVETSNEDAAASARKAGLLFFGIGYGAAYVGALALPGRLSWLYAPVVGPFFALEGREDWAKALLIADGVLQSAGAALLIGGIAGKGKQLVRIDFAGVKVVPSATPKGCGVGVLGAF